MAATCWVYKTINRKMVSLAGGGLRGDAAGEERVGTTLTRCFWRQIERRKKNKESDGALDFDGFC
jgi:hypothetical protein